MERDLLNLFLRSGPARQFDVRLMTQAVLAAGNDGELLFKTRILNNAILFKTLVIESSGCDALEKTVATMIYVPYDENKPQDGGESLVFNEENFRAFIQYKSHSADLNYETFDSDLQTLEILDSIPTFSPLVVELAFQRANVPIPPGYLRLPPDIRAKLISYLKSRIRPLVVAAYDNSKVNIDHAVENMTSKLLLLDDLAAVLPLVQALRIPSEQALEVLSSWIGLTYFEYEYASLQSHLQEFAAWLAETQQNRNLAAFLERGEMEAHVTFIRGKMRENWGRVIELSGEYRESYTAMISHGEVKKFTAFLVGCRQKYFEMGEVLGRFEQTANAWWQFRRGNVGNSSEPRRVSDFLSLLRKLHGEPPRVNVKMTKPEWSQSTGFGSLAADLF